MHERIGIRSILPWKKGVQKITGRFVRESQVQARRLTCRLLHAETQAVVDNQAEAATSSYVGFWPGRQRRCSLFGGAASTHDVCTLTTDIALALRIRTTLLRTCGRPCIRSSIPQICLYAQTWGSSDQGYSRSRIYTPYSTTVAGEPRLHPCLWFGIPTGFSRKNNPSVHTNDA